MLKDEKNIINLNLKCGVSTIITDIIVMKTKLLAFLILPILAFGQAPVVYINFVSHNEPGDQLNLSANFSAMNTKVLQLAAIIDSKGASWNLETCDGYASGALTLQGVTSNIFKTITSGTYVDNIEIDPRLKTGLASINIADTYRLLDTLGCNPTHTMGGFTYFTNSGSPDWFVGEDTIVGLSYPWKKWKANLMWGAGSNPPHSNDLNDWGIWKPDTTNNFYSHTAKRSMWYVGNGCQPLQALDPTENEQTIITKLKGFIDSIQNGLLPQNKFYNYSVTINQSGFGTPLFQKISNICDSVNAWGTSKIRWAKLTEKFTAFQAWKTSTGLQYSQWNCGQTVTGISEEVKNEDFVFYPNPTSSFLNIISDEAKQSISLYNSIGEKVGSWDSVIGKNEINILQLPSGVYFIKMGDLAKKIIVSK